MRAAKWEEKQQRGRKEARGREEGGGQRKASGEPRNPVQTGMRKEETDIRHIETGRHRRGTGSSRKHRDTPMGTGRYTHVWADTHIYKYVHLWT